MTTPVSYLPPIDPVARYEALAVPPDYRVLAEMVVASCPSPHTRRVYAARLNEFLLSGYPLTRDGVQGWLAQLRTVQLIKASVHNQCLAAVKKLAVEAELRGLVTPLVARGVEQVKSIKTRGTRTGNWLTLTAAHQLMSLPDRSSLMGKRDACIVALLLGCGLRREEATSLTWKHYAERDGRMCLVDIVGKGGRVRTIAVTDWARQDINAWMQAMSERGMAKPDDLILHRFIKLKRFGPDSRPMVSHAPLTPHGCWFVVAKFAKELGVTALRPHDLRRTLARLMRKAGADWEQIQFMLGHESIETTQQYVGTLELDEGKAGVDLVQW